ncbi:hypothetical protein FIM04_00100 [SAR202 cluster bacterium AC-409-J13_OGT_754m]|nr:hypothetical protein [SAR202 cluster bacterium AC-409-J13_OGT_754m]
MNKSSESNRREPMTRRGFLRNLAISLPAVIGLALPLKNIFTSLKDQSGLRSKLSKNSMFRPRDNA